MYTPGPWKYCGAKNCKCGLIWSIPADAIVANAKIDTGADNDLECITNEKEFRANAELISMAPEMYMSINRLMILLEEPEQSAKTFNECILDLKKLLERLDKYCDIPDVYLDKITE